MLRHSLLRPLEPEDRASLLRLYTDPSVRKYLGGPVPQIEATAKVAALYDKKADSHVWAICGEPPGKFFLGLAVLNQYHKTTDTEVSYLLLPEHQGQGHAARAVEEVLFYAFNTLALERVVAETQTRNTPSVRLALRVGMKFERSLLRFGEEQSVFVVKPVREAKSAA